MQWVIGIDEAGRGPLAGPIAVGAVAIPVARNEWRHWNGLKDSKQLSEKQRESWFAKIRDEYRTSDVPHSIIEQGTSDVPCSVAMVGARVIDRVGITHAALIAATRDCAPRSKAGRGGGISRPWTHRSRYMATKTVCKRR